MDTSRRISLSGDVIDSSKTFKASKQVQPDSASDESSSSTSSDDEDVDRSRATDALDDLAVSNGLHRPVSIQDYTLPTTRAHVLAAAL